jgi:hypothetical protein
MKNRRSLLVLTVLVALSACAGTLEDPERFAPPSAGPGPATTYDGGDATPEAAAAAACPDIPTTLFVPRCGTAGCHGATNSADGLDLVSPNVAARVVNVPAASGGVIVDPAHPDQSVLYQRIAPGAASPMPPSGPAVEGATVACVLSWASSLSAPDAGPPASDAGGIDTGSAD